LKGDTHVVRVKDPKSSKRANLARNAFKADIIATDRRCAGGAVGQANAGPGFKHTSGRDCGTACLGSASDIR
jgi:hypothetical protein